MAESREQKRRSRGACDDPARGLKRDTRRDTKRKRFGLKITRQWMDSQGCLGKSWSWTTWYATAEQRDEALRTESAKGQHTWHWKTEVKSFEKLER